MAVARRLPILSGMYPACPFLAFFASIIAEEAAKNREEHSVSSHSVHTQSNSVLHDGSRTLVRLQGGAATTIFDQAMVTAVVSVIAYIAAIMIGWL
jgi:hypothetical protein